MTEGDDTSNSTTDDVPSKKRKFANDPPASGRRHCGLIFSRATVNVTLADELRDESILAQAHKNWISNEDYNSKENYLCLFNTPFKHCLISDLFADSMITNQLYEEIEILGLKWNHRLMDLYEFNQTDDLVQLTSAPQIRNVYCYLKDVIMPWMSKLTGMELNKISASCSKYTTSNYLLTHDDMMSDRKIAFIYYISPYEDLKEWTTDMGGALDLFNTDKDGLPCYPVAKSIFPKNNQFVFFEVSDKSFHQVAEVLTKNYTRISINGWFHGPVIEERKPREVDSAMKVNYVAPRDNTVNINQMITEFYTQDEVIKAVQLHIEENSEFSLESFFIGDICEEGLKELQSNDLKWMPQGPANIRHYEVLDEKSVTGNRLKEIYQFFNSKQFCALLQAYTELKLDYDENNEAKCFIEIQRWTGGNYSVIGNATNETESILDIYYYFNAKGILGVVNYVAPDGKNNETKHNGDNDKNNCQTADEEESECGSIEDEDEVEDGCLLSIYPRPNSLNLAYRSDGVVHFTKYISKQKLASDEFIYVLYANYKEY